jgi:hypothetical protein
VFQEILEEDWCQPTPGGNVVQWAAFSYWLLSRGQSPLSRGRPVVLGEKIQGIHPDLASLIEVCLFGEEQARPATGPELMALLRLVPCGFLTTAPSPSPKREGPKSQPIELQRTLGDLRKQGNIARVPDLLEKPVKVLRDRLEALELLSVGELGERPSRAMAGIGLGLLALLCSLFLGSSVEGPAPRPETTEFSSLEVRAEDLRNDPYLVKLLRIRSVSAEDFSPIWNLVRTLAIQGRLPVKLRDQKRILAMHSRFPEDPDGACNQLEGLLEELRGVVGKE